MPKHDRPANCWISALEIPRYLCAPWSVRFGTGLEAIRVEDDGWGYRHQEFHVGRLIPGCRVNSGEPQVSWIAVLDHRERTAIKAFSSNLLIISGAERHPVKSRTCAPPDTHNAMRRYQIQERSIASDTMLWKCFQCNHGQSPRRDSQDCYAGRVRTLSLYGVEVALAGPIAPVAAVVLLVVIAGK
jgi:hypothetical protein